MADMQEVLMQTDSFGIIPNFQGEVKVIKPGLLGHEWDEDLDNGFRLMRKLGYQMRTSTFQATGACEIEQNNSEQSLDGAGKTAPIFKLPLTCIAFCRTT